MELLGALPSPADLVELRSTRRALLELALLAVAGGVAGAFVVLRRLAFFSHAVGSATFPGLVLAEAASVSPRIAAIGVAAGYAGATERAGRHGRDAGDAATALVLVAALGLGIVLASDVFESGAAVDRLLFGSAIALDDGDLVFAAAAALLALVSVAAAEPRVDRGGFRSRGCGARWACRSRAWTWPCWAWWRWSRPPPSRPSAPCWSPRSWPCPPPSRGCSRGA